MRPSPEAPEKQLKDIRITGKTDSFLTSSPPVVDTGSKCLPCQPLYPLQSALQVFTDASNESWGVHLGVSILKGKLFVCWLLELCQSRSKASLTKCQQELKFLRDAQPEQSEAKWAIRR